MGSKQSKPHLTCVHCRKVFSSEVLGPESEQAGVKCPHCKLFMPLERVEDAGAA